jgi:hypothetical protein
MVSPDPHTRHSYVHAWAAPGGTGAPMFIRLVRKLAEQLDGIDMSAHCAGDVIEMPRYEADLLIAEEWAVAVDEPRSAALSRVAALPWPVLATTQLKRRTVQQLRCVREGMAARQFKEQAHRRAEDRIREELHDERAKTITGRRAAAVHK